VVTLRHAEIRKVARYIQDQKQQHQAGNLSALLERIETE